MFKKVLSVGLVLISPALLANELTSFDAITQTLSLGKDVSAVVNMKKCVVTDPNENKMPISTATIKLETSLYTEERLSFDAVKYARPIPDFAPNGLMQRVSVMLAKDGNLNAILSAFDAETNKKSDARKDVTLNCKLGESVRFYQN